MDTFSIGRLAHQAGVGIDTIRYYEREGLLPIPQRLASGYRRYDTESLARLRFIRRAKALGFTLPDIADLLDLSRRRDSGAADVKARAQTRLDQVERQIHDLQQMRRGLRRLIAACPGEGASKRCPILQALSDGETS